MNEDGSVLVKLHQIAHGRTGDKGNRLNVNIIAFETEFWPVLLTEVREERIAALFAHRGPVRVRRYELPKLEAMNFVIDDVLEGGVNSSLSIDTHGKTLSFLVLGMTVRLPANLAAKARPGTHSIFRADNQTGRTL